MNAEIYQYQIALLDELAEDCVRELAYAMKIEFNYEAYMYAENTQDKTSLDCICILRDKINQNRFILVDTVGYYIYHISVRCTQKEEEQVKDILIKAYNVVHVEGGNVPIKDLRNYYNTYKDFYIEVLKIFNVESI